MDFWIKFFVQAFESSDHSFCFYIFIPFAFTYLPCSQVDKTFVHIELLMKVMLYFSFVGVGPREDNSA